MCTCPATERPSPEEFWVSVHLWHIRGSSVPVEIFTHDVESIEPRLCTEWQTGDHTHMHPRTHACSPSTVPPSGPAECLTAHCTRSHRVPPGPATKAECFQNSSAQQRSTSHLTTFTGLLDMEFKASPLLHRRDNKVKAGER